MRVCMEGTTLFQGGFEAAADACRQAQGPVMLTRNGEPELVVMEAEAFWRWEKLLNLREELLAVRESRLEGVRGYTISETAAMMRRAMEGSKPI